MDRMYPGPRARTCGFLVSVLSIWLLVACAPMTDLGMAPLFPTRTVAVPSRAPAVAVTTSAPVVPTATPEPEVTAYPLAPATMDAQAKAWLDGAALTADLAKGEEWESIQRAARGEGHLLLYSDTARMLTALESFVLSNPGVDGEVRVLTSDDALLALRQSPRGIKESSPDICLVGDGPLAMQALAQNRLWNYVPAELRQAIPAPMREPLLVHHWSAMLLMQRGTGGSEAPVDSWWDLTREEWRGRVALPDPAIDRRSLYFFLASAQHAEDLAQAYRLEFGHELVLEEGCPDAGCQWIKLLFRNDPHVLAGDAEVADWVGDAAAPEARLGICGSEQLAKVQRGKVSLSPVVNLAPTVGLFWPTYLAMVVGAPHPNAARVMIRWLMSDTTGEGASVPWYEAGHYFPREDMPVVPAAIPGPELEPRLWKLDSRYALEHMSVVRDWISSAR